MSGVTRGPAIAVVGAGDAGAELRQQAVEVGREVARAGAVLVCGGLGGVMESAACGARELGGATLGVLPGNQPGAANRYVQYVVASGMGEARNAIVVASADAVVALEGGAGTLAEIGHALKLRRPVVALNAWRELTGVRHAETAAGAVIQALSAAGAPTAKSAAALPAGAAKPSQAPEAETVRGRAAENADAGRSPGPQAGAPLTDFLSEVSTAPFNRWMGFVLESVGEGEVVARAPWKNNFANVHEVAHGGVVTALMDYAAACAVATLPGVKLSATISLAVNFTEPALNTELVAHARIRRRGRRVVSLDAEARDREGKLIAQALLTYRVS